MPFPTYSEVAIPLLRELQHRGGRSSPRQLTADGRTVYDVLADVFQLSESERSLTVAEPGRQARSKWENIVRWVRNDLRKAGLLDGTVRGVWALTAAGVSQLAEADELDEAQALSTMRHRSPADFLELHSRRVAVGLEGEEYVLSLERTRLLSGGRPDLASAVHHVANEDSGAGFDILSFELDGSPRHIEVKTSTLETAQFYLSANELRTARRLRESYFVYRVTLRPGQEPHLRVIKDLAHQVELERWVLIPENYRLIEVEAST